MMKKMLMNYRAFALSALALALLAVSVPALAATDEKAATHVGKVVSVTGNKLVMTSTDGKEHSHTLAADAKVTCDGDVCKSIDLKAGTRIRVTTQTNDAKLATRIEAIDKSEAFNDKHVGKVVSITGTKLVMTSVEGEEHSHSLTADAKVSCDGKVCNAEDLKVGTKIRVTTQTNDAKLVTCIEAIDKNKSFVDTLDGEVVSITGTKLVMTIKGGKEHSHALTEGVRVTCDGKVCKSSDLKPGMKIRVTSKSEAPHTVTQIEALDKNLKFASL